MSSQEQTLKQSLRKLSEKYLSSAIMRNDILYFLKNDVECHSAHVKLAEKSGKNSNSTYKDINEHSVINAISLIRYWHAMQEIARESHFDEQNIPKIDDLLKKYANEISFINGITDANSLDGYIKENEQFTIQLVNYFHKDISSLSKNDQDLLNKLLKDSPISQHFKESKLERMKRV
ncbi:hypothetical protein [Peribacillus sp. TH14]|uniref:hypothetical protein n=1 Tax=Peribacillus sp. TH14 TaxID=2798481 RepID=UPI0019114A56|nr:hypothetical protein [Peribacillus sp. TH14]MBK5500157.1 hypothetical protein [Peribacillus sp. TH14]